jgi:hypothetical protein
VGKLVPIGGVRLSGAAGARVGLGLVVWLGPKWLFLFFLEFLIAFLFLFL